MRAWRFNEPGPIENLKLVNVDPPEPREDEVVVRVIAAGLNPADRYLVQGQYPRAGTPPFTPGRDGMGVIEKPMANGAYQAGDRVVSLGGKTGISEQGFLAEYAAVPERWLAPLPKGWSPAEGAAGPLVLLTAWRALVVRGELQAGQTVLITGASGGVGSAAVMLAKGLGARVVALSRSAEKRAKLEALGADITVDSNADDLEKQVKKALAGSRIDLVVENLGGPFLNKCLNMTGPGGRIMVVGLLAGLEAPVTIGLLIHKALRIEGVSVGNYTPEEAHAAWTRIVELLGAEGQKPLVDHVYPMEAVQDGFARLAEGPMGKIIIDAAGD